MIARHIERVRRALWTWRQPLTRVPASSGSSVSDLFLWRKGPDWETYFELIDTASLFGDAVVTPRQARFVFFDQQGRALIEESFALMPHRRNVIDLGQIVALPEGMGSFAVFHPATPAAVSQLGSFLSERGYVSYRYRGSSLRAYVHGNLDAIANGPGSELELLAEPGLLRREYRLQHLLEGPAAYEIAIVNPSSTSQRFSCRIDMADTARMQEVQLQPRAAHLFPVSLQSGETARIVMQSRMVMARPLVFKIKNQGLDVFHG